MNSANFCQRSARLPLAVLTTITMLYATTALPQASVDAIATSPVAQASTISPSGPIAATAPLNEVSLRLTPLTRDELAKQASAVRDLARDKTAEVAAARIAVREDGGGSATAAQKQLQSLIAERRILFERLKLVLDDWTAKGGDADAIAEYRQYMSAISAEGIKAVDFSALSALAMKWLKSPDGGIKFGIKVLGFIIAFLVLLFVARQVSRLVKRGLARASGLSTLLKDFLQRATFVATVVFGLLLVLSMMGVSMGPVFAVVGGASFIIAFAMQSTLSNFAAGLMIMIYKPFDVGHFVTLAGVSGTVKEVSLVSTTLSTPDNQTIMIPNGNVWGSIITNVTANDTRRVDLSFGIGYADDADKAQSILEEIVAAHPQVLKDPAPVVRMHELADSSVKFVCRPWTKTSDYWAVYWDLTREVKARFDRDGISIPFPQHDVHVYQHKAAEDA
ncbi:MAG: mechanosensitive ion channel family protein [Gammaproteobacteria bacterium]